MIHDTDPASDLFDVEREKMADELGLVPGSCTHSARDGMTATEWHKLYLWDSRQNRRIDRVPATNPPRLRKARVTFTVNAPDPRTARLALQAELNRNGVEYLAIGDAVERSRVHDDFVAIIVTKPRGQQHTYEIEVER